MQLTGFGPTTLTSPIDWSALLSPTLAHVICCSGYGSCTMKTRYYELKRRTCHVSTSHRHENVQNKNHVWTWKPCASQEKHQSRASCPYIFFLIFTYGLWLCSNSSRVESCLDPDCGQQNIVGGSWLLTARRDNLKKCLGTVTWNVMPENA